jgi:hypothetical protein
LQFLVIRTEEGDPDITEAEGTTVTVGMEAIGDTADTGEDGGGDGAIRITGAPGAIRITGGILTMDIPGVIPATLILTGTIIPIRRVTVKAPIITID